MRRTPYDPDDPELRAQMRARYQDDLELHGIRFDHYIGQGEATMDGHGLSAHARAKLAATMTDAAVRAAEIERQRADASLAYELDLNMQYDRSLGNRSHLERPSIFERLRRLLLPTSS